MVRKKHSRKAKTSGFRQPHIGSSLDEYLKEISNYPMLKPNEEYAVAKKAQEGDQDAIQRMIEANLRFVIYQAKKYQNQGLELTDLISLGNEGLSRGAKKFDPDKGVKFISYVVWWIKQAILKGLSEESRNVRVPLNKNTDYRKAIRVYNHPEYEGLSHQKKIKAVSMTMNVSIGLAEEYVLGAQNEVSLNAPKNEGANDVDFEERLGDERSLEHISVIEHGSIASVLDRGLEEVCNGREIKIMKLYYGLNEENEEYTLEEIGKKIGVTRERVRQIRERAFEKIRKHEKWGSVLRDAISDRELSAYEVTASFEVVRMEEKVSYKTYRSLEQVVKRLDEEKVPDNHRSIFALRVGFYNDTKIDPYDQQSIANLMDMGIANVELSEIYLCEVLEVPSLDVLQQLPIQTYHKRKKKEKEKIPVQQDNEINLLTGYAKMWDRNLASNNVPPEDREIFFATVGMSNNGELTEILTIEEIAQKLGISADSVIESQAYLRSKVRPSEIELVMQRIDNYRLARNKSIA